MRAEPRAVRAWRWIAAVLALNLLAAPFVADAVAGNFLESGATNEALITPAGYAYGLWGLITALSAVTAVAVLRYGLGAWWETSLLIDASVVFVGVQRVAPGGGTGLAVGQRGGVRGDAVGVDPHHAAAGAAATT